MSNAILDGREAWGEAYARWAEAVRASGRTDFTDYPRPRNEPLDETPGIDVQNVRLLLISSAGGYDPATQTAFDAGDLLGDYSIRELPFDHPPESLGFAHDHYDGAARDEDVGVLLPHRLLTERLGMGFLSSITETWVSFMGYQPDLLRVVDELCPQIVDVAKRQRATGALLVPS